MFLRLYTDGYKHPAKSPYMTATMSKEADYILSHLEERDGIGPLRAILGSFPGCTTIIIRKHAIRAKILKILYENT